MKSKKNYRDSNFELLRIVAMYMIVLIHLCNYSIFFVSGKYHIFLNGFINGICNIGVSCFILISGYFGLKFDLKKLVRMECMMISYSLVETVILYCVFPEQMQGTVLLEQIVKSFFPFLSRKYWFYSCYVCILIFSGFIQKFIDTVDQTEFRRLLAVMLCLFSLFPTIFYFEIIPDNGKGLVQMVLIYLIGRYLSLYGSNHFFCGSMKKWKPGLFFLVLWVINGVSHEIPLRIGGIYHHFCKDNSITNIVMAVLLFCFFKGIPLRSKVINKVSEYIFAIFALNNTLIDVGMELLKRYEIHIPNGISGVIALFGFAAGIMCCCVLVGIVRNLVLRRVDLSMEKQSGKVLSSIERFFV